MNVSDDNPSTVSQRLVIEVNGLRKCYGALTALSDISFQVFAGSVFCILGPNGAGKTTLLKILTTITRPDQGHVNILGRDIQKSPLPIRRNMGVVSQTNHFETYFTVWENLTLHAELHGWRRRDYEPRIKDLLDQVGLYERRHAKTDQLSGGMQRRIALIRALIHEPKILFLDEPTTGLDPVARRQIWDAIRQFCQEATVILTTHYMEEADALSDTIVMLSRGHIVMKGSPRELKRAMSPPNRFELILKTPKAAAYEQHIRAWLAQQPDMSFDRIQHAVTMTDDYRLEFNLPDAQQERLLNILSQVHVPDILRVGELETDLEKVFLAVAERETQSEKWE